MRRERITYTGAYHHVMNRGYDGNDIFAVNKHKNHFLNYFEDSAKKMRIRLFAYCIMDNHYHLVLENSSGRISDFLKLLNGQNTGKSWVVILSWKWYANGIIAEKVLLNKVAVNC